METPKQLKLILRQWVALHKMTEGPITEDSTHTHSSIFGEDQFSASYQKRNKHQPSHKTFDLQSILFARYARGSSQPMTDLT